PGAPGCAQVRPGAPRCLSEHRSGTLGAVTRAGETADALVVGGGTIGGWCAWFLRRAGLARVVLVERSELGRGASSRAAGMVRTQGGTPWAVKLGMWTTEFYRTQRETLGVDSGFVAQGYLMPAFTEAEVERGRARVSMQEALGLGVAWLDVEEADELFPAMTPRAHLGGSYASEDGYVDPPRNVTAYASACLRDGVDVRERDAFVSLRSTPDTATVVVETERETISAGLVVLTGGPDLAHVGRLAGTRVVAGAARHQVAVTAPHPTLAPERIRMAFDIEEGIYWRPEDGGCLFGMSNPLEPPGAARDIDWPYLEKMRKRLAELIPATRDLGLRKAWAATIEYTPDHLPILGAALDEEGGAIAGVTVACAAGHGMMWGPAVARVAADLALEGRTEVLDASGLGLERFDAEGASSLPADPIALPFPTRA
ncbi:MAG: NAD(P)/FAD-dependent oxidoreductase, partial [Solirubrobacteraceae bacterium]